MCDYVNRWFFKKNCQKPVAHCCSIRHSGFWPRLPGENYPSEPDYYIYVAYCGKSVTAEAINPENFVVCNFAELRKLGVQLCDHCLSGKQVC
jgi:hypothetical protein